MAYATQDDLVPLRISMDDLIELTSDTDVLDPTVVDAALDEASSKVDAYCAQRYQVPLQASAMAKSITIDLALFILASRRRDTKPSETWTQNRELAMSLLRDISNGKASLDIEAAAPAQQLSSNEVTVTEKRQRFDEEDLRGFC